MELRTSPRARWAVLRVEDASDGPGDLALLEDWERRRNDALVNPADRASHLAAHLLVRACVAGLTGDEAADVRLAQRCPGCASEEHGRPYVVGSPQLHVSLSHSRRHVAAVASYDVCGIDVEDVPRRWPAAALSSREAAWVGEQPDETAAFTRLWVRKEALAKAGHGALADASGTCVVSPAEGEAEGVVGPASEVSGFGLTETLLEGAYGLLALWRGPRSRFI